MIELSVSYVVSDYLRESYVSSLFHFEAGTFSISQAGLKAAVFLLQSFKCPRLELSTTSPVISTLPRLQYIEGNHGDPVTWEEVHR